MAVSPGGDTVVDKALERFAQVRHLIRGRKTGPPTVASLGHQEQAELGHNPDDGSCDTCRDDQTGEATQGGFRHGAECQRLVVLSAQLDRLQGANISGDERENRDSNATLHQNAQERELQYARLGAIGGRWQEKVAIKGTSDVGQHHQGGSETA